MTVIVLKNNDGDTQSYEVVKVTQDNSRKLFTKLTKPLNIFIERIKRWLKSRRRASKALVSFVDPERRLGR